MKRSRVLILISGAVLVAGLQGCASTSAVDQKIAHSQAETEKKIQSVESQIEELQEKQKATNQKIELQQAELDKLSQTAKDALNRAVEAGVVAKGKVVMQETFSEDRINFKTGAYDLDKNAKAALDEFASRLKDMGKGVYLEIQGHTDNKGGEDFNDLLAQQRAEAVRRYLARQHKFPLGRMATISYGDTAPVESNKTAKGRARNRRVVIVVLE